MEEFKIDVMDDQQQYIRIRIICLGAVASSLTVESLLFNDLKIYNITQKEDINEHNLQYFIDDSDIVFLVADLDDDFVVRNVLKIIELLSNQKKIFTTLLANVNNTQDAILWILRDIRHKSSLLVVENQDDFSIKNETSIAQMFKKIIYALCDLVDEEIEEIRVHETTYSSLMSVNSFFSDKSELYLYLDYTEEQARIEVEQKRKLGSLLEKSTQIWIRHPFVEEDQVFTREINDYIEFFEENIDEDADFFLSPKKNINKSTNETKITVLIAVPNNMKNPI